MKKLSQLLEAKIDIQDETINFIDSTDLKKYLEIADRFISDEAKTVVKYFIENNDYVNKFGNGDSKNAIANFYNGPVPTDVKLKEVYKCIGKLAKANRLLEIPMFQTDEQFEGIISKKISPDEILLDLNTAKGRNEVVKKYDKLCWKIAREYVGKSTFELDDLYAYALEGLTNAMNWYGKKTNKNNADEEKIKAFTFYSYASRIIRFTIIGAIREESHMVRIPVSQQNKERAERGANTVSNTISGDKGVGADSDGNEKSMFDKLAASMDVQDGDDKVNREDFLKTWKEIFDILKKKFSERDLNIFCDVWGIYGHEELKGREIADKYGLKSKSSATYISSKVFNEIEKDKKLKELFIDAYELMHESLSRQDYNDHSGQVYSIGF